MTICGQRIAVVTPARSEAGTIGGVLTGTRRALNALGADPDMIVVNDQSVDATESRAKRFGATVVSTELKACGLGAAFRLGVSTALHRGATLVLTIDADAQYDPDDVPKLFQAWSDGGGPSYR